MVDWTARILLVVALVLAGVVLFALATMAHAITLTWDPDPQNNTNGYEIQRCRADSPTSQCDDPGYIVLVKTATTNTMYVDPNEALVAATSYCYRVRGYNAVGLSDYSNVSCSLTPGTKPPIAPSGLTTTP